MGINDRVISHVIAPPSLLNGGFSRRTALLLVLKGYNKSKYQLFIDYENGKGDFYEFS